MNQAFIKIIFSGILLLCVISQQIYPKDSLLIDTDDYRLFYCGKTQSLGELKSRFICHTAFVNVPIDPSFYKAEYPNPCSPSVYKSSFIYRLTDTTEIKINIIDTQDSILFNLKLKNQAIGYYVFIIKSNYFIYSSINKKLLSSFENIRIAFLIEDEEFRIRLSNLNY